MTDHLSPVRNERGFAYYPEIDGTYADMVKVYESSAASRPHMWLHVQDSADFNEYVTVHLSIENAVKLAEQILHLAANHYQNPEASD